jgi:hypothetical protein
MRKKNKNISDITVKDVKNYFKDERYKIKKEVDSFINLPEKIFSEMNPVFAVSTGRAGSELLVKLMNESKIGNVYHEPRPGMFYGSKLVFETNQDIKSIQIAYLNARYDLLKKAYLEECRYIETNNRNTFFIKALSELFPKSKFIHLVRHPGDFVRSGIRRKYYKGNEYDDSRLTPLVSEEAYNSWNEFSDIEKIGWLWNTTNNFIEKEKLHLTADRVLLIKSEDLFSKPDTYNKICKFINEPTPKDSIIKSITKRPTNKQKQSSYPKWIDWSEQDKEELIKLTPLGNKYGYWT